MKLLGPTHTICANHPRDWNTSELAKLFAELVYMRKAHFCIWHKGNFFRFNLKGKNLFANGTWVEPSARKQGIGVAMWDEALSRFLPRKVYVKTVSKGGAKLMKAVARNWPEIVFNVSSD